MDYPSGPSPTLTITNRHGHNDSPSPCNSTPDLHQLLPLLLISSPPALDKYLSHTTHTRLCPSTPNTALHPSGHRITDPQTHCEVNAWKMGGWGGGLTQHTIPTTPPALGRAKEPQASWPIHAQTLLRERTRPRTERQSLSNRLTKKGITMAKPNEYIFVTRKNFFSNDNEGRMVEKSFLEIQGTFLVKIHDNTFNGIIVENAFKHIDNFLEVVGPLKINGLRQDRFRLSVFPISLAGAMETDEDDDPNDIADIFKIEGNLFDFETLWDLEEPWSDNRVPYLPCDHICEPYRFKNGKTKWPTCSSKIDGFCNGGELPRMSRFEELWGNATPGVMKFCAWLKNSFENFHELDYDGPYANAKTERAYDPYLDINRIFGRNYKANNADNTQDNHVYKKEHHDPSVYNIRRFEMMKYSFDADDEYVAIKERKHSYHSRTNVDACQAYQELFCIIDEGWLLTKAKEE
ncbi:hypothetical protein Tco_1503474 [Tanacetum coccineum]